MKKFLKFLFKICPICNRTYFFRSKYIDNNSNACSLNCWGCELDKK